MAKLSQASVAEMMRLASRLGFFDANFMGDRALVSRTEIRRFLFSRGVENRMIDLFDRRNWNFDEILPEIVDGTFGVATGLRWNVRAELITTNQGRAQQILTDLASALIVKAASVNQGAWGALAPLNGLLDSLQRDGFKFEHERLIDISQEVVDLSVEETAIEKAIREARHDNKTVLKHHLDSGARYFAEAEWGPSASEWRHFFEEAIRGAWRHTRATNPKYAGRLEKPSFADALKWLTECGFFSQDETTAYGAAWGFLSVGNHPGIKPQAVASLCRSLAMTLGNACLLKLGTWNGFGFG